MDSRNICQFSLVALVISVVDRDKFFEAFQAGQSHCRRDFAHLAVGSDRDGFFLTTEAKILHCTNLGGQGVVICNDCSTLEGIEELGGVKTKDLKTAEVADHAAFVRAAKRVRSIEYQRKAMVFRNPGQGFDFAGPAPQVDADDPACAGSDQCFYPAWFNVVRTAVYVTENRREAEPLKGMGGGDKGERWYDYFPGKAKSLGGDLQRHGCVAYRDAVPDSKNL